MKLTEVEPWVKSAQHTVRGMWWPAPHWRTD